MSDLEDDPHPALARLRAAAPVSWVPALGAWLVTGYQLAVDVLRDARTFTVDDPRFSTAKVVGPSMLSLDGARHAYHRGPFGPAFRPEQIHARLASFAGAEAGRLVSAIRPRGRAELRRAVAGPLTEAEAISDAAVLMFGGIETTEGMIANAVLHLLSHPGELGLVLADRGLIPAAIEESLRLEPAAAVVDRYATRDTRLGGADIRAGDQVTVSLAGANRDPAVFRDPDRFDIRRPGGGRHLAFAHGPHFCLGAHLARLEARVAVEALLALPRLRLDPRSPSAPRGLVFRKPPDLHACWNPAPARVTSPG